MFTPSRREAREFIFATWIKYNNNQILTSLEALALKVMLLHPEYHAMLSQTEKYLERDYLPEFGETNPFLHISMHLAIEEQFSIDQPTGIGAAYESLLARLSSEHDAKHRIMDCLAETLWQAQRNGGPLDAALYLECIDRETQK
ncbi:MAG: DUF1841 family protein [Burkholderiales bacterium]